MRASQAVVPTNFSVECWMSEKDVGMAVRRRSNNVVIAVDISRRPLSGILRGDSVPDFAFILTILMISVLASNLRCRDDFN